MSPATVNALDSGSFDKLLRTTAETLAAAIGADHVRMAFVDERLDNLPVIYRDEERPAMRSVAPRLDDRLEAMLLGEVPADLDQLRIERKTVDALACFPPLGMLQPYGWQTGLFIRLKRDGSRLSTFAGCLNAQARWSEAEATRACELLDNTMLALGEIAGMLTILHAKHQCESIMDSFPQLIALLDASGRVLRTNRTRERWGIGMVDDVRGTRIHDMLHPSCNDWNCRLRGLCDDLWQQFENGQFVEFELRDQQLDRDLHLALLGLPEYRYADAENDQARASLVVEDISRRAQAERTLNNYNEELEERLQARTLDLTRVDAQLKERIRDHLRDAEALRELNKKYTCLLEATLMGIYVIQNGRLVFCNGRFANIFGYSQEELQQLAPGALFPVYDTEAINDAAAPCLPMEPDIHSNIARGLKKNGETLWLQRTLATVDYLGNPMMVGNVIDITAQKKMEEALRDSTRSLQLLSKQLIHAQEEERKRIAAELHDSVGQSISAVKFSIEKALGEHAPDAPQESSSPYLHTALLKLSDTMEEVRRISMDLRPPMLDDLGLIATINWLVRDLQSLVPEIRFEHQIELREEDIPGELKIVIFRLLQEALNNSCKHAHAGVVSISLKHADAAIMLCIQDDGRGFSPAPLSDTQAFGLGSMRERVALSGGSFTIESAPGAGTTIRTSWKTKDGDAVKSY